jgi:C4-dicarboxylate transporter
MEARYSKDLTLCQAKVEEFQISETKYELNIVFRWKSQQKSHYESENLEDIQFDMKNMNTINLKIYSCFPCLKIVIVVIAEEAAKSEINNNIKLKDKSIFLY